MYDLTRLIELKKKMVELSKVEKEYKAECENALDYLQEHGLTEIDNDQIVVKKKLNNGRSSVDVKKLRANFPHIVSRYTKIGEVKNSVSVTLIKENKEKHGN